MCGFDRADCRRHLGGDGSFVPRLLQISTSVLSFHIEVKFFDRGRIDFLQVLLNS